MTNFRTVVMRSVGLKWIDCYWYSGYNDTAKLRKERVVEEVRSLTKNNFLTNIAWFQELLGEGNVILRHTSALECLGLFVGYFHENRIDVYAKEQGSYENINYHVVNTFDNIETVHINNLLCTSVNQTFNDMLSKYGTPEETTIDEQSLLEGLSKYYFSNNESFDGLHILPENLPQFEKLREWAVEYYDES